MLKLIYVKPSQKVVSLNVTAPLAQSFYYTDKIDETYGEWDEDL